MHSINVTDITVKQFRVICFVQVSGDKYSNPKIKEELLKQMPNLASHKCKNSKGESFVDVMANTSLPHLMEHMIIDIQSKSTSEPLFGTSEWVDEEAGTAKIELSYKDDLNCLDSIKSAAEILNSLS